MAHNINYSIERGTHSLYSLKDIPWHGLGQIVQDVVDPIEAMRLANLDYNVKLARMYASFIPEDTRTVYAAPTDDNAHRMGLVSNDGARSFIPAKGSLVDSVYATYREDNHCILGTVGKRYEIVQNIDALEFIYNAVRNNDVINPDDIVIETAGALGKGERIFVTAKLPSNTLLYNGTEDVHDKYIVFTTSHDGSSSIQAMFTSVRVVCNNTLNAALGSAKNILSFKHTRNVKDALKAGAAIMNSQITYNTTSNDIMYEAMQTPVDDLDVLHYIADIFIPNVEERAYFKSQEGMELNPDKISVRKLNVLNSVYDAVHNGVGQDSGANDAYWLYNGVTTYLNNNTPYDSREDKFNSFVKGNAYRTGQLAMNHLIKLIA